MSDWRDWLHNVQPLEWPALSASKWNLTSTSSSGWFSKKVGINQDSVITPPNIQSDSVYSCFLSCFHTVENADLQSTQEDLSTWGHDPPLLWWLGQIQLACCQHQLNLNVYTHSQNLYSQFVNTCVWKLLYPLSCVLSFNNIFSINKNFLWF